jgi:hypothetical protein
VNNLSEKYWLDRLDKASQLYNEERAHRDFQADEIYKFVEWLHKEYGYVYTRPPLTNKNHS